MDYVDIVVEIWPLLNSVKHIVLLGPAQDGMLSYKQLIADNALKSADVKLLDTDPAYIIYTSGTTSKPKGVIRSHKSIISTATATSYHHGLRSDDVCYLPNPPFHISFVWPLVTYYLMGCTTIIERWNTLDALRTISAERVSFGVFVPFFVRSLLNSPEFDQFDLSSLRRLSMGSAPMDESLARRAVEAFGNIFNYNYGMTEYGSPISMIHGDSIDLTTERGRELLSSVGKGVFNADVRVVDADGNDVKAGQTGEVLVRGDSLMSGYWNMPEETARSMRGGYFCTGDIARVDFEGNLFIVDRAKDMIITGGENVFCPEVESAVMSHPAVKEAAVIGVPDEQWGEAVKGVVILRDGAKVTSEELRDFCRECLAGYKIPKSFEFVDEFPRTSVGKIAKRTLREPFWAGRDRNVH
jgi:long-chain acyl-CoA synthetase